ncbi:MAG: NifB/NifX family molybdenum-iron cluster-binding protein [Candidatus Aminicenantales bacterium]
MQTAQLISSRGVNTVLTGSCGPYAQHVLNSSGIKVVTGAEGKVRDVLAKFKNEVK